MMNEKFLVDLYTKKIFGPYRNKRKMEKDLKIIKETSDMFLEVGSNILVLSPVNLKTFIYSL
jgi:hypothetical protein